MTQNTQRCRWCKELYRGKCGCDAEVMLEKMAGAATQLLANQEGVEEWQELAMVIKEYREIEDANQG